MATRAQPTQGPPSRWRRTAQPATRTARALGAVAAAVAATCAPPLAPTPAAAAPPAQTCGPVTVSWEGELPANRTRTLLPGDPWPSAAHLSPQIDMDGDDLADSATDLSADDEVSVTRGDGVLTVTGVPVVPRTGFDWSATVAGDDLDGDGRDELIVRSRALLGFHTDHATLTLLVPGTTAPGSVAAADGALSWSGTIVGDVDGDDLDDLRSPDGGGGGGAAVFPGSVVSGRLAIGGPDPTVAPGDLERTGLRRDLDEDGVPDRVGLGSVDGSVPARIHLSATGTTDLPTGDSLATPWVSATVEHQDVRTIVELTSSPAGGSRFRGAARIHVTCAAPWMQATTALLLGRAPTSADYPTFGPLDEPDRGARQDRTRQLIRSQTGRGHQVDGAFAWYLGRQPDPSGRAWWVAQLRSDRSSTERLERELLGSSERFRRSGATAPGWVDDAYPLVYGRGPDPAGRSYWIAQVHRLGVPRTAARMLGEPAADRYSARRLLTAAYDGAVPESLLDLAADRCRSDGWDAMAAEALARPEPYLRANL